MPIKKKKIQSDKPQVKKSLKAQDLNEKIRKKAYELYQQRGGCHGKDCDDWYEAEKLIKTG